MPFAERRSAASATPHAPGAVPSLVRVRRRLVLTLVALVVAAWAVDVVRDGDHWPMSSYSMFAELRAPDVRLKRLVGVHDGHEIDLVVPVHLPPFHEARLMTAFRRLGRRADGPEARRAALVACLDRYEALRVAGVHDGPPLETLRYEELAWPLESGAANRSVPFVRRRIAEVSR